MSTLPITEIRRDPEVMALDQRVLTAHHEAGHAVAAFAWLGRNVAKLTIVATADQLGSCHLYGWVPSVESIAADPSSEIAKHYLPRHLRYAVAGRCAEAVFLGPRAVVADPWVITPDWEEAIHCAELLREEPYRAIRREVRRTKRLIRDHWAHVTALAQALLERETLTDEMIRSVLDGLPWILERQGRRIVQPKSEAATAASGGE
jgi:ATP-dependent Zn protease